MRYIRDIILCGFELERGVNPEPALVDKLVKNSNTYIRSISMKSLIRAAFMVAILFVIVACSNTPEPISTPTEANVIVLTLNSRYVLAAPNDIVIYEGLDEGKQYAISTFSPYESGISISAEGVTLPPVEDDLPSRSFIKFGSPNPLVFKADQTAMYFLLTEEEVSNDQWPEGLREGLISTIREAIGDDICALQDHILEGFSQWGYNSYVDFARELFIVNKCTILPKLFTDGPRGMPLDSWLDFIPSGESYNISVPEKSQLELLPLTAEFSLLVDGAVYTGGSVSPGQVVTVKNTGDNDGIVLLIMWQQDGPEDTSYVETVYAQILSHVNPTRWGGSLCLSLRDSLPTSLQSESPLMRSAPDVFAALQIFIRAQCPEATH